MLEATIGLGVILSLLFAELLGASAGGIVVPGYIAMYLDRPGQIFGTLIVSLVTWGLIKIIGRFAILYGKRRMVLSILIGFILGWFSRSIIISNKSILDLQMQSIGYIIPGLIANWFERQGFIKTISAIFIAAVVVRLAMVIISGGEVDLYV